MPEGAGIRNFFWIPVRSLREDILRYWPLYSVMLCQGHGWQELEGGPAGDVSLPAWISCGYLIKGIMSRATMLTTLIIGLMAGPAVSL
jgi:hypothetical protein